MKTLLILGAGTGGTMVANKMSEQLDMSEWKIIIVDRDENHYYQPGLLFIPFDIYSPTDVVKPKRNFIPPCVTMINSDIEVIEPDQNRVRLKRDNKVINYDYLVIATGTQVHPEETEGMTGGGWYQNIFDFYTLEGATALSRYLKFWKGGRLVLNIAEMPIKCPVAPLEFMFLADWNWFSPPPCPARLPSRAHLPSWVTCSKRRVSILNPILPLARSTAPNRRSSPSMAARSTMTCWLPSRPTWARR
jgi:sulfide:quinone oxidoreductase